MSWTGCSIEPFLGVEQSRASKSLENLKSSTKFEKGRSRLRSFAGKPSNRRGAVSMYLPESHALLPRACLCCLWSSFPVYHSVPMRHPDSFQAEPLSTFSYCSLLHRLFVSHLEQMCQRLVMLGSIVGAL